MRTADKVQTWTQYSTNVPNIQLKKKKKTTAISPQLGRCRVSSVWR